MSKTSLSRKDPSTLRRVDPALRLGQVGDGWGNLLAQDGEFQIDDELVFEGDRDPGPPIYRITRANVYPLDRSRRLYFYQRVSPDRAAE